MRSFQETNPSELQIRRPSLPVIHLATAVQLLLHLAEAKMGRLGLEALLLERQVIELVVRTAEYHRSVIAQSAN